MIHLSRREMFLGATGMALASSLSSTARAMGPTAFNVTIRNVTDDTTLKLPDGRTASAPIAPGVYVVGKAANVLFTPGGMADEALERLAEDGNFQPMLDKVAALKGLSAAGMFVPGQTFAFTASPGDRLQFATMFVQSNDLFFAPKGNGIPLFDSGGRAVHGKVTNQVGLYDAGTEINQAPGAGPDQAPRQARPNTGRTEQTPVELLADRRDGFAYPAVERVIEVEITPGPVNGL